MEVFVNEKIEKLILDIGNIMITIYLITTILLTIKYLKG
jgi:hypothetical protein